jgi:hypothetical protein
MKKAFLLFLLLSLAGRFSFGQALPGKPVPVTKIVKVKQPLIIIGTLETNALSLVVAPENLQILKTYQDSLDLRVFGEKGEGGVVIAALKDKAPLFRLPEVLDHFKVPAASRHLKIMVDQVLVSPELFLADVKRIARIEKVRQDLSAPLRYSFREEEEFLNVVTVKD